MDDKQGYAVFFFPPALEALGDAIKPYLVEGLGGAHVLCREIDTGGALIEMTLDGLGADGTAIEREIMVPTNMVRMIVSVRGEGAFGFGPRIPAQTEASASPARNEPDAATPETPPARSLPAGNAAAPEPRRP